MSPRNAAQPDQETTVAGPPQEAAGAPREVGGPATADSPLGGVPIGILIVAGFSAITITVAGLRATAGIVGPLFLAIVLVITVYPVRHWLDRRGLPGWLATTVTIVSVYLILTLMTLALVVSMGRLTVLIPIYVPEMRDLIAQATAWLDTWGVGAEQIRAAIQSIDVGRLLALATNILSRSFSVLSALVLVATLVLFIGFDSGMFPRALRRVRAERPAVVAALFAFAHGTRRYFAVSAVFGLIVAVIDIAALAVIGIPAAFVWGVLAFVTNFIPNIGFLLGVIPPAVVGLLEGGVHTMIIVVVVYTVINFVIQTVIQPKFVGDAFGISSTITFVSLLFWAWVLGPLGAVLAIPLTLLAKALLIDIDPRARWLAPLVSGKLPDSQREPPAD